MGAELGPLTAEEAAQRNPNDPMALIGRAVQKDFPPHGVYDGTVVSFDRETGYRVRFSDNELVDHGMLEIQSLLLQA